MINIDFEDGQTTLLLILGFGGLLIIVVFGLCACYMSCPCCCGCSTCRRNENNTPQIIEMGSREHHYETPHHCDTEHDTNHEREHHTNHEIEYNRTVNISRLDEIVGSIYAHLM